MNVKQDRKLATFERQREALELRQHGYSYAAIAQACGYAGASGAYKAVERALADALREPCETLRTLELSRLDALQGVLWPLATGDGTSTRTRLAAVDRLIRLSERRCRLMGLDAPPPRFGLDVTLLNQVVDAVERAGMTASEVFTAMLNELAEQQATGSDDERADAE